MPVYHLAHTGARRDNYRYRRRRPSSFMMGFTAAALLLTAVCCRCLRRCQRAARLIIAYYFDGHDIILCFSCLIAGRHGRPGDAALMWLAPFGLSMTMIGCGLILLTSYFSTISAPYQPPIGFATTAKQSFFQAVYFSHIIRGSSRRDAGRRWRLCTNGMLAIYCFDAGRPLAGCRRAARHRTPSGWSRPTRKYHRLGCSPPRHSHLLDERQPFRYHSAGFRIAMARPPFIGLRRASRRHDECRPACRLR